VTGRLGMDEACKPQQALVAPLALDLSLGLTDLPPAI